MVIMWGEEKHIQSFSKIMMNKDLKQCNAQYQFSVTIY